MKNFIREDQLFSLCSLNCGLCPMQLGRYCPGCGGGVGNQPCKIAKCSLEHGKIAYCNECESFPVKSIREKMNLIPLLHTETDIGILRS